MWQHFSYDFLPPSRSSPRAEPAVTTSPPPLPEKENVGRPAQSTPTNPANGRKVDLGKVDPSSRLSVPGRLSGEIRLGQDAGG